jgi:spore germination protein KC
MKKKITIIFLICLITLTGCFGYRDIDKALFCTAIIIDVDENENVLLYTELFHSYRSKEDNSETGTRIVLTSKGKTLFEAIRDQNKSASYKINYEQNKVIIFTKRAAEYGIDNFIDYLNRDQELLLRQYIMIFEGSPEDLIKLKIKQEEYIGLFIYDLLRNEITKDFADVYQVFEYLNDRHFGQAISVMSIIRIKEETIQEDLIIEGSGIIKDGKMIEKMEGKDAASHSAIVGKESIKIINIPNPMNKESDLILEMIDSNLSTNMIYKDNQIILKKDFDIRASLAESQKPIIFEDPKIQKEVEKLAEKEFEKMCMETFEKYKKKGLDVFRIKEMMLRKYPNIDIENPIRITDLKISVNMKLEGSSDVIGFKK